MQKVTSILATRSFEKPASEGKVGIPYSATQIPTKNDNNTNTVSGFVFTSALPEAPGTCPQRKTSPPSPQSA